MRVLTTLLDHEVHPAWEIAALYLVFPSQAAVLPQVQASMSI